MYLFIDTETTGRNPNKSRSVQIAWILADRYGHVLIEESHIIRPEGFQIELGAIEIHGITHFKAMSHGKPIEIVLNKLFDAIRYADVIIGHNISFDIKILQNDIKKAGINFNFDLFPKICTMMSSTAWCGITKLNGKSGFKWPKLNELHIRCFGFSFDGAHDALTDVKATMRCFYHLLAIDVIEPPPRRVNAIRFGSSENKSKNQLFESNAKTNPQENAIREANDAYKNLLIEKFTHQGWSQYDAIKLAEQPDNLLDNFRNTASPEKQLLAIHNFDLEATKKSSEWQKCVALWKQEAAAKKSAHGQAQAVKSSERSFQFNDINKEEKLWQDTSTLAIIFFISVLIYNASSFFKENSIQNTPLMAESNLTKASPLKTSMVEHTPKRSDAKDHRSVDDLSISVAGEIRATSSARALNKEAIALIQSNNHARAIAILKIAAAKSPADAEILGNLGYAQYMIGDFRNSIDTINKSIKIKPRRGSSWNNLGLAQAALGYRQQATLSFINYFNFSSNKHMASEQLQYWATCSHECSSTAFAAQAAIQYLGLEKIVDEAMDK